MAFAAVLIGCGYTPSEADVNGAVQVGYVRNAESVMAVKIPEEQITSDQAYSIYRTVREKEGWEQPERLQAIEIVTDDGRKAWSVYPADAAEDVDPDAT
ncbi:MAG: hypothetical protein ACYS5V_09610 [Planctomycetota bacterium]|jgi:hypothetical protein